MKLRGIVFMIALAVVAAAQAQDTSLNPGINRYYENPDFDRWQAMFETAGREVFDKRREIVAALEILPGMSVADVGAGTGVFTVLFSQKVGDAGARSRGPACGDATVEADAVAATSDSGAAHPTRGRSAPTSRGPSTASGRLAGR